jgi:peptidoglycan/LPS O-acetylase OafA/YrhL
VHVDPYTGHFWSLAVEEHFYLVWPLALMVVPRRWWCAGIAVVMVAVLMLRASTFVTQGLQPAYYLT